MTIHSRRLPVGSPFIFVHRIAKALAKEPQSKGVVNDAILRGRVAQALSERIDLVDWPLIATWMCKAYHGATNKALNKTDSFYIPSAFIRIGKGLSVEMQRIEIVHVDLLDTTIRVGQERFNTTTDRKLMEIGTWRRDLVHHPEMPTLGVIQRDLRGYIEKPGDPDIPDEPDDEPDTE